MIPMKYRALLMVEVEAVDRPSAEVAANKIIKSKKLEASVFRIEEG